MGPVTFKKLLVIVAAAGSCCSDHSFAGLLLLDFRALVRDRGIDGFMVEGLGEPSDRCLESGLVDDDHGIDG